MVRESELSCQVSGGERTRTADFYVANRTRLSFAVTKLAAELGFESSAVSEVSHCFRPLRVQREAFLPSRRVVDERRANPQGLLPADEGPLQTPEPGDLAGGDGVQVSSVDRVERHPQDRSGLRDGLRCRRGLLGHDVIMRQRIAPGAR